MVDVAEADVFRNAEGTMRVAERPGRLPLRRGQRAGHADKDSPGTWEILLPPSWGSAERSTGERSVGDGKSERLIVPAKRGNQPNGTPWREGGAGSRTRLRER